MPLLVITGPPCSGKTTVVERVVKFLYAKGFDRIEIVADDRNAFFLRNFYNDSYRV